MSCSGSWLETPNLDRLAAEEFALAIVEFSHRTLSGRQYKIWGDRRCKEIQDARIRKLYSELVEIADCEEKKLQQFSKRPSRLKEIQPDRERSRLKLQQFQVH